MSDRTKPPWRTDEHGVYIWANDERGDFPVAQLRGWGHLTGAGGLNLSPEEAIAIQKANAAFIVRAANCHDDILRELRHLVRLADERTWPSEATLNGARAAIARAEGGGTASE